MRINGPLALPLRRPAALNPPSPGRVPPLNGETTMQGRPTWQGHLRLSLVTCPVALYTATASSGEVHFNMLHKTTHNRIRMLPTDPETGPVDRDDIVKGYEVDKDRYVVV